MDTKVSVSVSIGSSKQTSEQTVHTETVNTSNINAGGAVRVIATAGDVTLTGVKINAVDVNVAAAKNINLNAAQNKQQIDTKTSSSSWSVGAGINTGYTAGVSKGSGKEHENSVANVGSVINASGTVQIAVGNDLNINGSQVKGDKVVANVGGNLNIASLQDTNDYTAKNKNSRIELSTGIKTGTTGSIGNSKTNSTYASVTEQAGIFAGKGGFDLTVGKNTDLKGAVIASEATSDKNKLSTDTLTFSNIKNEAEYKASSTGFNYSAGKDANGKDVAAKDQGLTPNIGIPASGEADSTTKSAIANGTIEVRSNPNQDLAKLSRDTAGSLNALGKIFDKKTVQEKQELSKLFGEVAYEQVHILATNEKASAQKKYDDAKKKGASPAELKSLQANVDAWGESGINKIALHATVGGLMSEMGGSGFASGAVGAGINEAAQKVLSDIKDPGLHQIASALLGAAAAKVAGGNAQAGASTAASGTKNNYYSEEQLRQRQEDLSKAETPEQRKAIEEGWDEVDKKQDKTIDHSTIKETTAIGYDKDGNVNFILPRSTVIANQFTFTSLFDKMTEDLSNSYLWQNAKSFSLGLTEATGNNLTFGLSSQMGLAFDPGNKQTAYYLGKTTGDLLTIAGGTGTAVKGGSEVIGGFALYPSGVGVVPGVVMQLDGVVSVGAGVSLVQNGVANLSKDGANLYKAVTSGGESTTEGPSKAVDDILKGANPGRATKGKATQWEKSGGSNQAMDDFNSLGVQNVRDIPGGKVGTLPDGRTVNVRTKSSDGRPTLEIYDGKNSTKIRYDD